jgi:GNAT superfamily N-acetyltransferase
MRLETIAAMEQAEPLFHQYVDWARQRLAAEYGIEWSDADAERVHDRFRAEWPKLVGERGRVYLALVDAELAGVGALKPRSMSVGEIKRVFVRPQARGAGVARTLMARLLDDASALGFETVCLDTMAFMTDAHRLYRSLGFVDAEPYAGEAAEMGLGAHSIYLELATGERTSP